MLRGTDWVVGLVLFTGHESKLMQNAIETKVKRSRVEKLMSWYLIGILIFLFLVVFSSALAAGLWNENVRGLAAPCW